MKKHLYLAAEELERILRGEKKVFGSDDEKASFLINDKKILSVYESEGKETAIDEIEKILAKMETAKQNNERLNAAIMFAVSHHAGQVRKKTTKPYILHPLEVMQLLSSMEADTDVMIAGVLHDVVEDTDATIETIRALFGEDVADMVSFQSEDKSKTWDERKQHAIDSYKKADIRTKMLVMADKGANIKSIAVDYEMLGEDFWSRFNAGKDKQEWYYRGMIDALSELRNIPECKKIYDELEGLVDSIFRK